jgi:alpha-tubulin suppressor-like RCC1 family protein
MGYNSVGQLGDGTTSNAFVPEQIVSSNVVAIAAGGSHALFLKPDGSAWGTGYKFDGETNVPEQIVASGVTAIAAGEDHSLFLKSDGSLWAMGLNNEGELGDGTDNQTNQPEQIIPSGVTAIAAGTYHSLFLKSDGSLWAMGLNIYGELGDGTGNYSTNRPEQIVAGGVTAIAGGYEHSLFVKSDGSLWAMGWNDIGQLGDGFVNDSLVPEQIFPLPQPILTTSFSSGTGLQINATTPFGGTFYLLAGTNLTLPLQWTPIWTNSVTTNVANNFSVTLTNAVNSAGQQFYFLKSQ